MLCAAFAFIWLFIAPYQMGLAFDADGSGRVASLVPAAQLFGIAFGRLQTGQVNTYAFVLVVGVLLVLGSFVAL